MNMRFCLYRMILCAALIAFGFPVKAAESPTTISWAKVPAPPFFINTGPEAGQGFADGIQTMLEQALPHFEHQTVYMPLTRLKHFWQEQANYCFAIAISEPLPSDASYVLSQPNMVYLPHGIIVRRTFESADGATTISFKQLLNDQKLVWGSMRNRRYGPTLDRLMEEYKHTTREQLKGDRDGLHRFLQMLVLGRIDFLVDYPFVYEYFKQQPEFKDQLRFLVVEETLGHGILGSIGCTSNPWGKAVIVEIDRALERLLQTPKYRNFIASWLAVGMDHTQYWQLFEEQRRSSEHNLKAPP